MNGNDEENRLEENRLKARYRRLLAWYPAGHRQRYGEEILGALLAASRPGQARPDRREALDLVVSGLRLRFAAVCGGGPTLAARSAASVFGLVTSVALAALSWHQVALSLAERTLGGPLVHLLVSYRTVAMAVGWTVIAVAGALGLRRVAALGAVMGLAGEAAVLARQYAEAPDWVVWSWTVLTLIAVTAAGLVAAIAPARDAIPGRSGAIEGEPAGGGGWRRILRRDPAPLGRRPVVALAAGAVLMLVEPFVAEALMVVHRTSGGGWTVSERLPLLSAPSVSTLTDNEVQAGAILAVISVVVVLRLRPAVRRRVVLLAAPVAVTFGLIHVGFEGFMASSPRFNPPVYLAAGQWGALTLTQLLVFAFGAWLLRRYERKLASGALLA